MAQLSEETKGIVREIISEHLDLELSLIKDDSELRDLGADSLDEIELIIEFEKKFDISVPDSDLEIYNKLKVENLFEVLSKYIN